MKGVCVSRMIVESYFLVTNSVNIKNVSRSSRKGAAKNSSSFNSVNVSRESISDHCMNFRALHKQVYFR